MLPRDSSQHSSGAETDDDIQHSFDDDTHSWIQRLYEAWSERAPVSTFAAIRDGLLGQREHLDTRISTLCSVARIAHSRDLNPHLDPRWGELFTLAGHLSQSWPVHSGSGLKRKRAYNEANRLRNLALVSALWSPEVVFHYGWHGASQVQMNMLRACAARYPRFFQDFRPRLNSVLLSRHRQALQHGRAKTLKEAPIQPHRDFDLVTLASAVPDDILEDSWIMNVDGCVPVDEAGKAFLKDLRPNHFRIYLLRRDRYGLLAARGENNAPSSPKAMEPHVGTPAPWEDSAIAATTRALGFEVPQLHYIPTNTPAAPAPSTPGWSTPSPDAVCDFEFLWRETPLLPGLSSTSASSGTTGDTMGTSAMSSATSSCSALNVESYITDAGWRSGNTAAFPNFGPQSTDNFLDMPSSHSASAALAHCFQDPTFGWMTGAATEDLCLHSPPVVDSHDHPLTMEQTIHNRHYNMMSRYLQKISKESHKEEQACSPSDRRQFRARAEWLLPDTPWATVWTEPESLLPRGGARSRSDADVLYLTSDEAVRAARRGEKFKKPMVIKETFADSGMQTIRESACLFKQASVTAVVGSQALDGYSQTPQTIGACIDMLLSDHQGGGDPITVTFRNVTRSHRPLFIMLPRFRLLDVLVERLRGKEGNPPGHPDAAISSSSDLGFGAASCTSFNALSQTGAFSGPHVVLMSGVWLRNLDGIKFCSLLPEDALTAAEWDAFAAKLETGCLEPPPGGRHKVLILEQDDVFLIPPGLRAVVYALQSPTNGLMEGGIFWDTLNILGMLHSAQWKEKHWINDGTRSGREMLAQFPRLVEELEALARGQPDYFRGDQLESDFIRELELTISKLRSM
ncbi:hypothetical protein QBC35DRAFT_178221 [Podospora australis]|uniref:Uncharacterized protein n=1 Tax=Podospora australis TaxID=1536484 RepID=A0AAN6WVK5_9PEZI|nr:hypothetical protein QBC35DRAFT_178221 [Podospora australis]